MVQVLILNTDDFIFPDFIDCHHKGMFSAGGLRWAGVERVTGDSGGRIMVQQRLVAVSS